MTLIAAVRIMNGRWHAYVRSIVSANEQTGWYQQRCPCRLRSCSLRQDFVYTGAFHWVMLFPNLSIHSYFLGPMVVSSRS